MQTVLQHSDYMATFSPASAAIAFTFFSVWRYHPISAIDGRMILVITAHCKNQVEIIDNTLGNVSNIISAYLGYTTATDKLVKVKISRIYSRASGEWFWKNSVKSTFNYDATTSIMIAIYTKLPKI